MDEVEPRVLYIFHSISLHKSKYIYESGYVSTLGQLQTEWKARMWLNVNLHNIIHSSSGFVI